MPQKLQRLFKLSITLLFFVLLFPLFSQKVEALWCICNYSACFAGGCPNDPVNPTAVVWGQFSKGDCTDTSTCSIYNPNQSQCVTCNKCPYGYGEGLGPTDPPSPCAIQMTNSFCSASCSDSPPDCTGAVVSGACGPGNGCNPDKRMKSRTCSGDGTQRWCGNPPADRPCSCTQQNGLRVEYFDKPSSTWWYAATQQYAIAYNSQVDFNWNNRPPHPDIPVGSAYLIRWGAELQDQEGAGLGRGYIYLSQSGAWNFELYHDDMARLYIDGQQTISYWDSTGGLGNPGRTDTGTFNVGAAGWYPIEVHYAHEGATNAHITLYYTGPAGSGVVRQIVPSASLSSCSIPPTPPTPSTCTLSISPASTVAGPGGGQTTVTYSGNVTSTAPAQNVRLWLERRDGLRVPGGLSSSDGTILEGQYNGTYYYEVARCWATPGGSCNELATITAPPAGYYFHCDVSTDPGKCSGNPFCTYEGGSLSCTGWQSCSSSDNGRFDVQSIPNCKSLNGPSTIVLGNSGTYGATFENSTGNLSGQIFYDSYNNIVNQSCSGNSCYISGNWKPSSVGTYTVYCRAWNDAIAECRPPSLVDAPPRYSCNGPGYQMTVNVTTAGPWWQVVDSDVRAGGDLVSPIPDSCSLPSCNPVFGLKGAGGYPGVPLYGGMIADFHSGSETGQAAENPNNWLVSDGYGGQTYDYDYFVRQIPSDVTIYEIDQANINGGYFNSNGNPSRGYVWFHYNGVTLGDLTISGNANINGSRRVVLLVDGADLHLDGQVNIQIPASGFFMAIVGKRSNGLKGNIYISASLTHPTQPALEGIYLAEGTIYTGLGSGKLYVRGSFVGLSGIVLERNLTGSIDNSHTPAETFEYAPELMSVFPQVFSTRIMRWKEVAP